MIQITRDEAMYVRSKHPDVHIRKTRYKYYMEEHPAALELINDLRSDCVAEVHFRSDNRSYCARRCKETEG